MIDRNTAFRRSLVGFLALVVVLLAHVSAAQAATQTVGAYTIEVDVRGSTMMIIPHAHITASKSGGKLKVTAWAPGYQHAAKEIPIKTGVTQYSTYFVLRDVEKRLDVLTFEYKPIQSAYFERDQSGTPTDQYAINLFLPIKSWPHPSPANLIVNQPGYGIPIQNSCEITQRDEFFKVRMLISRAVLDDPNPELLIYVNTAQIITPATAHRWFATIRRLEATNPAAAADVARALFGSLPQDQAFEALPHSVARLLALRRRFETLHGTGAPETR